MFSRKTRRNRIHHGGAMTDLRSKIRDKLRALTLASIATVTEDGKPWSRYVVVRGDEDLNIWFATFKGSRKTQHIHHTDEVHLNLGVTDMQTAASWIQVQGRAQILADAETKRAVWYSMLEPIFSGPEDPNFVVCKVTPYRIEYYTMNRRQPEVWEA
jgi:general stress protein 26